MKFSEFRTAFWHLRNGGVKQMSRYLELQEEKRLRDPQTDEEIAAAEIARRDELRGFDALDFPAFEANQHRETPFAHYKVGAILDEFSVQAWGGEFTLELLSPESWQSQIEAGIDFLLVESAWMGNGREWQYQVVGSTAPSAGFRDLVRFCRDSGIPTVFWNKEDPVHFDDFIESARLFDIVATTDESCIPLYKAELPGKTVISLPFAAQSKIHHPMRDQLSSRFERGDVCFAGTYFSHKFTDRREQMERILNAGLEASESLNSALTIYSRNENVDPKYRFPAPFSDWVVGTLEYSKMLSAYRGYKVFLNVNTVTDSSTMFSRRVFEILASGTAVVSTDAQGLRACLPESTLPIVSTSTHLAAAEIEGLVRSDFTRRRMVHRAQRRIWERHTYSHRAQTILDTLKLDSTTPFIGTPKVSVIISSNRPERVDAALDLILKQQGVELEVLLATHGFSRPDLAERNIKVFEMHSDLPLGVCLNTLLDQASGEYIAKMDDDDYYGPNYLQDQVHAVRFSGAEIVGKQAAYLYLASTDELMLRKEWREHVFTDLVLGATLVGKVDVFKKHRFGESSSGEDTEFLNRVRLDGGMIYSADRFNYIQYRAAAGHSWSIQELDLKRSGKTVTMGYHSDHVDVLD